MKVNIVVERFEHATFESEHRKNETSGSLQLCGRLMRIPEKIKLVQLF